MQAGSTDLSNHWGGYQLLVNISEYKPQLDAMMGFKNTVTDHSTGSVLMFMDYKSDIINYNNKLRKIMQPK